MDKRSKSSNAETLIIFVDSYDNSVPAGQLYCPVEGVLKSFFGVVPLLRCIEASLDAEKRLYPFDELCGLLPGNEEGRERGGFVVPMSGRAATFSLCIFFRRGTSWQGRVTWPEGRQSCNFRSALELLLMMDSALSGGALSAGGDETLREAVERAD